MNEAETRAELIDPKLKECGWGVDPDSKVLRERDVCKITDGKITRSGKREKALIADYILVYKNVKLAVIEAKSDEEDVSEGVGQAKRYANKLRLDTTYATNGKEIYQICMKTGIEGEVKDFLSPGELWNKTFPEQNDWRETFSNISFKNKGGGWKVRYYQEIATQNVLEAIANDQKKILLTLATGTGKTTIAFQIAYKLFQARWNLSKDAARRPRILFLADRNILASQAFNDFNSFLAFEENALRRIKPEEIKKDGYVPTNANIFFTIFQTFMSGKDEEGNDQPYFGQYPKDFFDFIIIDECHRGGANDEGNWRAILEYFSDAYQLGLTATPKRKDNVDTYQYFGEPVYSYSLKEGINDGFLTPFKVKRIKTTLDDYIYVGDDEVVEGEIEEGKLYEEKDFNRNIEIKEREQERVKIFLRNIDKNEKSIIFCANQSHAALIRNLINQNKKSKNPNYCVRVTANDGKIGEEFLKEFQDNEKLIPTILTTSQKLSTGVDARNIRNIALMRPVNSMIEFKQIIGRGTRLFDDKYFFTIYDFVNAYTHFADPDWDGEPIDPPIIDSDPDNNQPNNNKDDEGNKENEDESGESKKRRKIIKVKLRDGKEREINHMISTSFWSKDGKPITATEFMENLFGKMPDFFHSEDELRKIWSKPDTRKNLLDKLSEEGFGGDELKTLQKLIDAQNSDLFDVLEYVFNSQKPITRVQRVEKAKIDIFKNLNDQESEFINFILSKYIEIGVEELWKDKLPTLLRNKYGSLDDAKNTLGDVNKISLLFIDFQKYLYQ
jgi:type I restriction enzyme R subunit